MITHGKQALSAVAVWRRRLRSLRLLFGLDRFSKRPHDHVEGGVIERVRRRPPDNLADEGPYLDELRWELFLEREAQRDIAHGERGNGERVPKDDQRKLANGDGEQIAVRVLWIAGPLGMPPGEMGSGSAERMVGLRA